VADPPEEDPLDDPPDLAAEPLEAAAGLLESPLLPESLDVPLVAPSAVDLAESELATASLFFDSRLSVR
jgi:hypothetical protein